MAELSRRERRRLEREQRKQEIQQGTTESRAKGKRKIFLFIGVIIILLIGAGLGLSVIGGKITNTPGKYDDFAKCLSEKGAVMYGAYWCPNCQRQELLFGNSFRHVNYVECDPNGAGVIQPGIVPNPNLCKEKDITGYPTWIFADGSRLSGEQSLQTLAERTGCTL